MLDGVAFAQHIDLLGVGEKEQQLLADSRSGGERDRWESVGPSALDVPSGTAAVFPLLLGAMQRADY